MQSRVERSTETCIWCWLQSPLAAAPQSFLLSFLWCNATNGLAFHFISISLVKQTDFFIYFSGPDFIMEYKSYPLRWCVFILDHKLHSCFYKGKPADCRTKFWSKLGKFLLKCTKPYKKGVKTLV